MGQTTVQSEAAPLTYAGIVLYALLLLYIFLMHVWLFSVGWFRYTWRICKDIIPWFSPVTVFHVLICIFVVVRWIWLFLAQWAPFAASTVFLEISFVASFSAFSVLLFHWFDIFLSAIRSRYKSYKCRAKREGFFNLWPVRWAWILTNLSVYLLQVILWIVFFSVSDFHGDFETDGIFLTNIFFSIILLAFISLLFAIFGTVVFVLLIKRVVSTQRTRLIHIGRLLGETVLLLVSLLIKVAFFLYRPISGKYFPEPVWYAFAYFLSELVVIPVFVTAEIVDQRRKIVTILSQNAGGDPLALNVEDPLAQALLALHQEGGEDDVWLAGSGDGSDWSRSSTGAGSKDEEQLGLVLGIHFRKET